MGFKPHTAMVFAAGLGKRMQPLTLTTPKPLISVAGRTMLDRALDHLVKAGVQKAIVNTHYLAQQIDTHLRNRTDIAITIIHEPVLLETGGGLKNALPHLGKDPIYVINSDIVWQDDVTPALTNLSTHWRNEMEVLLLLVERKKAVGYDGQGDFGLEKNAALTRPEPPRPFVFGGVQMVNPEIVANHAEKIFSLNHYYFNNPKAFGVVHDGLWLHIGTPAGLKEAEKYLA
jgi:MurNAc alpha-1-phosphate uridylyltransferase